MAFGEFVHLESLCTVLTREMAKTDRRAFRPYEIPDLVMKAAEKVTRRMSEFEAAERVERTRRRVEEEDRLAKPIVPAPQEEF